MANRTQQPLRPNKPLLPATDPWEPSEYGEEASSAAGSAAGKQPKRAKVTAVACQPCQKRKSKCDGLRPVCSSCQQKGRTDCVYDSSSDLRRTSALKQRIDNLQQEVTDLKDILLALCAAYGAGTSDGVLGVVYQQVSRGDFSRIQELAQVLRTNESLISARQTQAAHPEGFGQSAPSFGRFQQMPQGFNVNYQGIAHDGVHQHSATDGEHDWGMEGSQQRPDEGQEHDFRRGYMYHP